MMAFSHRGRLCGAYHTEVHARGPHASALGHEGAMQRQCTGRCNNRDDLSVAVGTACRACYDPIGWRIVRMRDGAANGKTWSRRPRGGGGLRAAVLWPEGATQHERAGQCNRRKNLGTATWTACHDSMTRKGNTMRVRVKVTVGRTTTRCCCGPMA